MTQHQLTIFAYETRFGKPDHKDVNSGVGETGEGGSEANHEGWTSAKQIPLHTVSPKPYRDPRWRGASGQQPQPEVQNQGHEQLSQGNQAKAIEVHLPVSAGFRLSSFSGTTQRANEHNEGNCKFYFFLLF